MINDTLQQKITYLALKTRLQDILDGTALIVDFNELMGLITDVGAIVSHLKLSNNLTADQQMELNNLIYLIDRKYNEK